MRQMQEGTIGLYASSKNGTNPPRLISRCKRWPKITCFLEELRPIIPLCAFKAPLDNPARDETRLLAQMSYQ